MLTVRALKKSLPLVQATVRVTQPELIKNAMRADGEKRKAQKLKKAETEHEEVCRVQSVQLLHICINAWKALTRSVLTEMSSLSKTHTCSTRVQHLTFKSMMAEFKWDSKPPRISIQNQIGGKPCVHSSLNERQIVSQWENHRKTSHISTQNIYIYDMQTTFSRLDTAKQLLFLMVELRYCGDVQES